MTMQTRRPGWSRWPAIGLLALAWAVWASGATAADAVSGLVLDLPGEGMLPGQFAATTDVAERQIFRWQSPVFDRPFEFRLEEVVGIRNAGRQPELAEAAGFRCRLHGGDSLDGEPILLDAEWLVLAVAGSDEPIRIPRSLISALVRRAAGESAGYVGPAGLAGWDQTPPSSWRDEAGRIATDQANASLGRDVGAGLRARYDLAFSWRKQPAFELAVAAGDADEPGGYRFEMLSLAGDLPVAMLVRQDRDRGDIAEVPLPESMRGELRLSLFVDQEVGRLVAVVGEAREAIEVSAPPAGRRSGRLRLTVRSGDLSLDSIRVSEWQGPDAVAINPADTQVIGRDGRVITGKVESLDAETGLLTIRSGEREQTLPLAELQELRFPVADDELPAAGGRQPSVRLVRWSGGVLSGDLAAVSETSVEIALQGLESAIRVPLADLRSLARVRPVAAASDDGGQSPEPAGDGPEPRPGRLLMDGINLPGRLAAPADSGGGLGWWPRGSDRAAGFAADLLPGLAAKVDYLDPEEQRDEALGDMVDVGGVGGAVNQDENGAFVITMLAEEGAAARDGRIEPGDRILAVRPTETARFVEARGLDLETVMNLLRGRVGTPVSLRIEPAAGGEPRQIDLVRGLIYVAERNVLDQALVAHARVAAGQAAAAGEAAGFPALVILRSGDVAAAAIDGIGPDSVRLRSPVTASGGREPVEVLQRLVQAVELDPAAASRPLDRARWERLLTLPRSQRDDPPTHLLRLRSGDYLRGNLEGLDGEAFSFRVLGQLKRLPREAVVRVIWLHPEDLDLDGDDEPDGDGTAAAEPPGPVGLVVQGVAAGGERTTLIADRVDGAAVIGTSPAFGPSQIDTLRIDRLLIGQAVAAAEEELPYAQWRLRLAPEPRALREER
ncbi:MAG: Thiol-disulfide oxidoreductase ResA [Planctomycetota bacterium]